VPSSGFVSNLAADRFPLEQLTVPTLVISARDDNFAPYRFAAEAAERIPGARLVSIESGCHWSTDALIALAMLSLGGLCPPLPGRSSGTSPAMVHCRA
jgi:pimeloyl-ACP methyl ester carboxylesterase